jgi:flagellar basal-body rod modification protein FlgD
MPEPASKTVRMAGGGGIGNRNRHLRRSKGGKRNLHIFCPRLSDLSRREGPAEAAMINTSYATASAASTGSSADTAAESNSNSTVSKDMFLQLLVAQIKYQDPMNPADGATYLTQLAQFQQLEQGINTGEDVAAIKSSLEEIAAALAQAKTTTD